VRRCRAGEPDQLAAGVPGIGGTLGITELFQPVDRLPSPDLVAALRDQRPLPDERLAALQEFVLDVVATAGAVSTKALEAFLGHGYTTENALEVVLGIGACTMSTLANRLVRAPLDDRLMAFAWPEPVA
jgi:hypothetical protein